MMISKVHLLSGVFFVFKPAPRPTARLFVKLGKFNEKSYRNAFANFMACPSDLQGNLLYSYKWSYNPV